MSWKPITTILHFSIHRSGRLYPPARPWRHRDDCINGKNGVLILTLAAQPFLPLAAGTGPHGQPIFPDEDRREPRRRNDR